MPWINWDREERGVALMVLGVLWVFGIGPCLLAGLAPMTLNWEFGLGLLLWFAPAYKLVAVGWRLATQN